MKIRAKLTIVTISLIVASFAIPSIIALESFSGSLESQISNNLEDSAGKGTDKVSRFLFERYGDMSLLTDPGNSIVDGSKFPLSAKLEYLRSVEKAYGEYSGFSIYNSAGIKIGDTHDHSVGSNDSDRPFFTNAMKGGVYYDTIPSFSSDSNEYVIRFSGPLHNDEGDITGVLVGSVPMSRVNEIVKATANGLDNAHAYLVSTNGYVIYSNEDAQSVMRDRLNGLEIFQKLNASDSSSDHLVSNAGTGEQSIYVAAKEHGFLGYKGTGWILVLAVPTDVAFKEVFQLQTEFIIIATIILVISVLAVAIFSNVVTDSLVKLKNAAAEIAGGNFDVKVRTDNDDEIGELSRQFDKMKNELKDRERLKDEFINIAAHELRSPLQPILSYNELALKGLIDKDEALKVIDGEVERLMTLANDILDVSRIEGSALTYHMENVKLGKIIDDVATAVKDSGRLSGSVSLQVVIDEKNRDLEIYADKGRLHQVFVNIIGNAAKFTKDGFIRVEAQVYPEENKVEVKISDTGAGIPSEIFPNLFGKFVTKSVGGGTEHGTGLGLFISKAIITAHIGHIHAENNMQGGATFTITLPINTAGPGIVRTERVRA